MKGSIPQREPSRNLRPQEDSQIIAKKIPLAQEQIDSLIQSLHLSPGAPLWFQDLVRDISRDCSLDLDPVPSSLDETPD